jgi:hypothetical protein
MTDFATAMFTDLVKVDETAAGCYTTALDLTSFVAVGFPVV